MIFDALCVLLVSLLIVASAVALVAFVSARAVACRSVWDGRDCLGCVGVSFTVRVVSSCIFGLTQRNSSRCFSLYRCFWLRHT